VVKWARRKKRRIRGRNEKMKTQKADELLEKGESKEE
jgi:hypothetical protein